MRHERPSQRRIACLQRPPRRGRPCRPLPATSKLDHCAGCASLEKRTGHRWRTCPVPELITTLGAMTRDQLGMVLPHEHVFVDLRTPDQPGYAEADPADVVRLMAPQIERIKALGVTALVECSTGGVGRRADIDRAVSE